MKTLTVIQLGDIHFPDHKDIRIGDLRDASAPGAVVDSVAPNRLELVMRKVVEIADDSQRCGLLVCGDLTTRGDLDEYKSCVEYLHQAIEIGDSTRWPDESLHVVPGNHDVKRSLCDPDGEDLFGKFDPLLRSWDYIGRRSLLPVNDLRSTSVSPNSYSLTFYSLNSCVGCGETRHLPQGIREQLGTTLSEYFQSAPPADAFDLVGEQLDTPAFVDSHIRDLVASINRLDRTSLPVVLAHHNALPQSIPRVEIYTELINGGLLRSELAGCSRPIIYCHGHIHDDPIEQICDLRYPNSQLIVISAPLLVDGFNTITVEYSRSGIPLGARIKTWRCTNHGSLAANNTISIPLVTAIDLPQFRDEKLHALLKVCNGEFLRFEQIREAIRGELGVRPHFETLGDVIREAEWLSLVEVRDGGLQHKHWKVRRYEP